MCSDKQSPFIYIQCTFQYSNRTHTLDKNTLINQLTLAFSQWNIEIIGSQITEESL